MFENINRSNIVVVLDGHEVSLKPEDTSRISPHLSDRPLNTSLIARMNRNASISSSLVGYARVEQIMQHSFGKIRGNRFGEQWGIIKGDDLADWETRNTFSVPGDIDCYDVDRTEYNRLYSKSFEGYALTPDIIEEVHELFQMGVDISIATGNRLASAYKLRELFADIWKYLNPECRVVTTPNYKYCGLDTKKHFVRLLRIVLDKKVILAEDDPMIHAEVADDVASQLSPYPKGLSDAHAAMYKHNAAFGERGIILSKRLARVGYDMKRGDLVRAVCEI